MLMSEWLSLMRPQNIDKIVQHNQCLVPSGGALSTYSLNIQREKSGDSGPRLGKSPSQERAGFCANSIAPTISPHDRLHEETP